MIPMSSDVRALVGECAEHVDNRSLLYEKFSLPKVWGHPKKTDDAGRWSVLRICLGGQNLLKDDGDRYKKDGEKLRRRADEEVDPRKRQDLLERAHESERLSRLAKALAQVERTPADLISSATSNARRFLEDIRRAHENRIVAFEATLAGRLMVNMAGGVIENAGICLDRCFGLPFIPGSAVKGIARTQALWEIKEAKHDVKRQLLKLALVLFGYGKQDVTGKGDWAWAAGKDLAEEVAASLKADEFKGCACFLPAYPTTPPTIVVDMVNPHYPEYYRGRRERATDDENPIPNYFPAVEAGSAFGFAVLLNRVPEGFQARELLNAARGWIERAITQKGLGAKTAAGYGWFQMGAPTPVAEGTTGTTPSTTAALPPPASPADALIAKWRGKLTSSDNFAVALPELLALADDADLKRAFEAVIPENERRRLKKNNSYWQSFTSGKHGEAGRKILARLGISLT